MAKRCLPSINVEGVTYPLMQVNDFSICNTDGWEVQLSSGKPSYVTDEGTEFYSTLFNRAWVSPSQSIVKNIERQKSFLKWFDYYGQGTTNVGRLQLVDDTNNSGFCQVGITQSTVSTGFWHICIIVDDALCLAWAFHYDLDGFWKYAPNDTKKRMLYDALVGITRSGGAGSGYIGNSLLSNKKMVGFNVPTSSSADTKTESVSVYSANAESNKAKSGNGYAKIKLLKSLTTYGLPDLLKTTDFTHLKDYKGTGSGETGLSDIPSAELGTDWLFRVGQANTANITYSNEQIIGNMQSADTYISGYTVIPIYHKKVYRIKYKITSGVYNYNNSVSLCKIVNGALVGVYGKSFSSNVTDLLVEDVLSSKPEADYIVIGTVKLTKQLVVKEFELLCE